MWRVAAAFTLTLALSAQYTNPRSGASNPPVPHLPPRRDVVVTFKGELKQMKKNQILIQSENQLLTLRRNKSTRFFDNDKQIKATDIDLETPVVIEASEDTDLKMVALRVKVSGRK